MVTDLHPSSSAGSTIAFDAIVCLDGSSRAADALGPALALANRRDEQITVAALHENDAAVLHKIERQLTAVGIDIGRIKPVATKVELLALLQQAAEAGGTPVLSAFGRWNTTGRLVGVLGDLVRSDVSRVLAVGPKTDPRLATLDGCLVVAADGVCSVEPLIEATSAFIDEGTPGVVLAHVVAPNEPGMSYTTSRNAAKFDHHLNVPVEAATIAAHEVGTALAELARQKNASLIIVRSWHRWSSQQPSSSSNSLSIVAEAPCPVLIVN